MIIKLAAIFNPMKLKQLKMAKPDFTPKPLTSFVKKFHPASASSNAILNAEGKQEAVTGIPKTKWWKKMERVQLN